MKSVLQRGLTSCMIPRGLTRWGNMVSDTEQNPARARRCQTPYFPIGMRPHSKWNCTNPRGLTPFVQHDISYCTKGVRPHRVRLGFTLIELLIAMFIFTILSMVMVGGLQSVIKSQQGTQESAERLRNLQLAFLVMSRDVEQTVNRPILNNVGKEEVAFLGTPSAVTFTHGGFANPTGALLSSSLQRTAYTWHDNALWRSTWTALDLAPKSKAHEKKLLGNVSAVRFEYLDTKGHFNGNWPGQSQSKEILPRAVRVTLTIKNWGMVQQLYVIAAQPTKNIPTK